ncbi:MAG: hypothetical protein OWT28_01195, partial [Firmicutes bacterium]|nr:hypothetical protein [Bacillota bacterium]
LIELIAKASFGVFLIHPLILHFIEVSVYALHPSVLARGLLTIPAIVIIYAVSVVVSYLVGKTPYLSYIVGQKVGWSTRKPVQRS